MILGLIGKARSGKSTVAEYLRDKYGFKIISAADPLKEMVLQALVANPPPDDNFPLCTPEEWKEFIYEHRQPFTRWLLQFIGTDIVRNQIMPNYWVNALRLKLLDAHDSHVVVPDIRFTNEARALRTMGGFIMSLKRTDEHAGVEHGAEHSSETEMRQILADFEVSCGTGIATLKSEAELALRGLL